eukprot:4524662-Prymnesium_polylepis.1
MTNDTFDVSVAQVAWQYTCTRRAATPLRQRRAAQRRHRDPRATGGPTVCLARAPCRSALRPPVWAAPHLAVGRVLVERDELGDDVADALVIVVARLGLRVPHGER